MSLPAQERRTTRSIRGARPAPSPRAEAATPCVRPEARHARRATWSERQRAERRRDLHGLPQGVRMTSPRRPQDHEGWPGDPARKVTDGPRGACVNARLCVPSEHIEVLPEFQTWSRAACPPPLESHMTHATATDLPSTSTSKKATRNTFQDNNLQADL